MATKPVAWQDQDPVSLPDMRVSESWAGGEVEAISTNNPPVQDKKAPRAEPEEDIDVLEHCSPDQTLQVNQTMSLEIADSSDQESTTISPGEAQGMLTDLEQVAKLSEALEPQDQTQVSVDLGDKTFSPPPILSALSSEEFFEKEGFSSPEGEVTEWITDAEIISDTAADLLSPVGQNSQGWTQEPLLIESVDRNITEDDVKPQKNVKQLNFLLDSFENREAENNLSDAGAAGTSSTCDLPPSDRDVSDDVYTMCSPPFADESEEEEEVSADIMCCQEQWTALDTKSKPVQQSCSADILVTEVAHPASTLPAVPSHQQQDTLLSQSQCEHDLRGANQEAAQQVLGQGLPPLSTVAMEPSNQSGAAPQGFGCPVTERDRLCRAGGRTEGECEQTGGEAGQKDVGLERTGEVCQQHVGGQLSKPVQTLKRLELKSESSIFVSSQPSKMESDSCDDSQSDSGVSADFSPSSTLEGNTTISTGTPSAVHKETPIEREIRRALEREHSLRRSRGLPHVPTAQEYVEIPLRRSVACQSLSEKSQGKERQFAGLKMQHEIHQETLREEELVRLGKVPGVYDRGTVRQLKERKELFEAFQKPTDSNGTLSARSTVTSWSSATDISTLANQDDISSRASTIGDVERSKPSFKGDPSPLRGPGFSEGTGCQVIILENNLSVPAQKLYRARPEAKGATVVDSGGVHVSSSMMMGGQNGIKGPTQDKAEKEEEEEDVKEEEAPKENPFFKLRSSRNLVKVEQDIREAQEREKELHKQRISLYGGMGGAKGGRGGGGGGRPASIEGRSSFLSPTSVNGLVPPGPPESPSGVGTVAPTVRHSVGKIGGWPPAQSVEEKIKGPEVLHSPRTPRQKTPLVQRWESGLVNGHGEDAN